MLKLQWDKKIVYTSDVLSTLYTKPDLLIRHCFPLHYLLSNACNLATPDDKHR